MAKKVEINTTAAKTPAASKAVAEAQARLEQLDRLAVELRDQLEKERAEGPLAAEALKAAIQDAQAQVDRIQAEINEAKSLAKKRKREIDEWKLWYQGLPGIDKTAEWAKLKNEIDWRGAEINTLQEQISILETKKWTATGVLETARIRLAAFEEGVYDRPLDDDLRLVALQVEREAVAAALDNAERAGDEEKKI